MLNGDFLDAMAEEEFAAFGEGGNVRGGKFDPIFVGGTVIDLDHFAGGGPGDFVVSNGADEADGEGDGDFFADGIECWVHDGMRSRIS